MENLMLDALLVLAPVFCVLAYKKWGVNVVPAGLTLPPGPTPLPILGNALDIDRNTPWLTYTTWAEKYGPIIYVRLLGRDVIVINSEEVLQDLVEKRSSVYSDKPRYVTNKFFGLGSSSGFLPYGDEWRLHRRLLHQTFRAASVSKNMHPIMLRKRRWLVRAIVDSPDDSLDLLHTYATSVIMSAVYGYEIQPKNDRLVQVVNRMLTFALRAMTPEREALASAFPIIQYIPTWMPGSQLRRDGLQCQEYCREMRDEPFEYTINAMVSGDAQFSMAAHLLSQYAAQEDGDNKIYQAIKNTTWTVFGAASGTTDASILCFILAMILYPDVQRRAQAEIDKVVEMDRLPDFSDKTSLPYADAILRELWRWHPSSPLGVPHATSRPDVYKGHYIPKGAMVMINVWAMTRAEKYPDPDVFRPERFLSESGALTGDDLQYTFGAGRRQCVGRHFAGSNVWLTVVTLLSCFEFSKVQEGWGIQDVKWTSGIAVSPCPFPFKIKIRERANIASTMEKDR